MSKSIYEEALENLHIHEHQLEETKIFERKFDLLKKVKQALEQAQKQEKLLVLYKQAYDKAIAEVLKMFTMKQNEKTTLNNIIGHLDDNKTVAQIRELEDRLKVLNEFEKYEGNLEHLSSSNILNVFNELENNLKCIENAYKDRILSLIRKALTPPTANEVIKALSEQLKSTIVLRKNKHGITFNYAKTGKTIISLNYNLLNIKVQLTPHIITMIGKFYESLEGEKNE